MPEPAVSGEVSLADIQRLLQQRGFDPGNDHGQLTQQTQLSIMEYENANGLSVDGQPDPVFIKHLLNQQ
jgi:peptidoglycan hydrolase-like protein with peptidoglycan-binding domain